MGARDARNIGMMAFLLAATLTLASPDTTKHSGAPRRVLLVQDSVEDEDVRDRWVAEDKLKHFTMSYGITMFAYAGGRMLTGHNTSAGLALGASGSAGILKEIYDRKHDKPFSLRDLTWDLAGIAAGYALIKNAR
jgi:uncharacterized protein YfiM (DUF2279 family)